MAEIEPEEHPPHPNDQQNVVSTGETSESDDEDMFSATDEEIEVDNKERAFRSPSAPNTDTDHDIDGKSNDNSNRKQQNADLLFYDENLDEEDEAYVYKHMRGGISENVTIGTASKKEPLSEVEKHENGDGEPLSEGANETETRGRQQQQKVPMLKPRHSDAVLSCPCCFNIVCMDCQKHKRYANQYRAMFVMGVVVDWNHILVYDETHRGLVSKIEQSAIPEEEQDEYREWGSAGESNGGYDSTELRAKEGEYYAVECAACRTQVAALDMKDEVYYFHGCLESSSAF